MVSGKESTRTEFLDALDKILINEAWEKVIAHMLLHANSHPFMKQAFLEQLLHADNSPLVYIQENLETYAQIALLYLNEDKMVYMIREDKDGNTVLQYYPRGQKNNRRNMEGMFG